MFKKVISIIVVFLVVFSMEAFSDHQYIDLSEVENGVVIVQYPITNVRHKAMLEKDGKTYYYDLTEKTVRLPLQMGSGTYHFAVLINRSGSTYAYQYRTSFEVESIDESKVYLNDMIHVQYNYEDEAIQYLDDLLVEQMTVEEKVEVIHHDLVEKLRYDYDKFSTIKGAYLPDIDDTFESQSGICYDFASLFAAMLRSEGIPTKLIMGYRADTPVYHAWNEVLLNGEWVIVDLTLDIEYHQLGFGYEMLKDDMFYTKDATY